MAKRKTAEQVRQLKKGVAADRAKGLMLGESMLHVGREQAVLYRMEGRSFRWLTLIDEFTRECLVLSPTRSWTGPTVVRELAKVVG